MELSDNQRLYLQVIFDYFHEHGKWPTYRYLDRKLSKIRRDLDIEKISKSLPGGWGSAFAINRDLNADAILSISAISICENSEEDLGDFIKTLNFCVERYFSTEEDTVVISSDGLAQHLNMSELSIRKVGLFLRDANEYPIYQEFGSRDTEYKNWVCTLSRNIRYFDGVMSLEKYLEKIEQLRRPSPTKIKSQSNSQQINKDKGLSFTKTRAIVFQHLVHDLLQCLGHKVETNARIADALVDFIAYFPADSPNDTVDEIWIIEVKYRNFSVGKDILYQLSAFAQEAKVSKILLVINSTLNKAAKHYASKRNDLEIWDGYKLLSLLEPFPELRQKYFEVLPQMDNPIDEGDLSTNTQILRHRGILLGEEGGMRALQMPELTEEQQSELSKAYRNVKDVRIRTRAQMVLLACEQHLTAPCIATIVREDAETVRRWLKRYLTWGIEGLRDRPRSGAPSKLTKEYKEQLLEVVRRRPRSLGQSYSMWTLQRLADYLAEHTGVTISSETLRRLLAAHEIVFSQPQHTISSPDPEYVIKKKVIEVARDQVKQERSFITLMSLMSVCCRPCGRCGVQRGSR